MPQQGDGVQKFARSTVFQVACMALALFGMNLAIAILSRRTPDEPIGVFVLRSGGVMTLMCSAFLFQRMEIDGSSIRVIGPASGYRWRRFDASEVLRMQVGGGGYQSMALGMTVQLRPAAHRSWNQVTIGSIMTSHTVSDYDTLWFVSVARAVAKVQPGIVVHNLPAGYDGLLRRPLA